MRHFLAVCICLAAAAAAAVVSQWPAAASTVSVPDMWSQLGASRSYHVMFKMSVKGLDEDVTVEEWADYERKLLRMDLTTRQDKTSFLFDGAARLAFLYRPFKCVRLDEEIADERLRQMRDLLFNLFIGYPLDSPLLDDAAAFLAYGLGPLWLGAAGYANQIKPLPASSWFRLGGKTPVTMSGFELSDWRKPGANQATALRLYFNRNKDEFLRAVEWVQLDSTSRVSYVIGRAVIFLRDNTPLDQSVFGLPAGYGCRRLSPDAEAPVNKPELWVELFEPGTHRQALIELTGSRALTGQLAGGNRWQSERKLLALTRSSLKVPGQQPYRYQVARLQSRQPDEPERIRRTRHVWRLAEAVRGPLPAGSQSGDSQAQEVHVYKIDDTNQRCLASGQRNLSELLQEELAEPPANLASSAASELNPAAIEWLFMDSCEYQLVREESTSLVGEQGNATLQREAIYEKRLPQGLSIAEDSFRIPLPVSIVKRVRLGERGRSYRSLMDHERRVSIQLLVYSQDSTVLQRKYVLKLLDLAPVTLGELHRQLDVSACFDERHKQRLVLKYPVQSEAHRQRLAAELELVQQSILLNLLGSTSLDLLQVSGVRTSLGAFYLEFGMTLLELPLTQTLELSRHSALSGGQAELLEQVAGSVELCAEACIRHRCYRFSFDSAASSCRMELRAFNARVVKSDSSSLYSFRVFEAPLAGAWKSCLGTQHAQSVHLSRELAYTCLAELVDAGEQPACGAEPLAVRLAQEAVAFPLVSDQITLRPSSLEREEPGRLDWSDAPEAGDASSESLRLEFRLLYEGAEFPAHQAAVVGSLQPVAGLEECARLCEDLDARSFSYSQTEEACRATNLIRSEQILEASRQSPASSIFVLDYLSKFLHLGHKLRPWASARELEAYSAHDCATACMEQTEFLCQAFHYCPDRKCLLRAKPVSQVAAAAAAAGADSHFQTAGPQPDECRLFARSYMSHFGKLYNKAIVDEALKEQAPHSTELLGVCHEQRRDEQSKWTVTCKTSQLAPSRSRVERRQACTVFFMSDRSQYNLYRNSSRRPEPAREQLQSDRQAAADAIPADDGQKKVGTDEQDSLLDNDLALKARVLIAGEQVHTVSGGSLSNLCALLIGLSMGACFGLIWKRRQQVLARSAKLLFG